MKTLSCCGLIFILKGIDMSYFWRGFWSFWADTRTFNTFILVGIFCYFNLIVREQHVKSDMYVFLVYLYIVLSFVYNFGTLTYDVFKGRLKA